MKSYTPEISWHNKDPVYTVDIQNSINRRGENVIWYRVATAGTDRHVIIWKVELDFGEESFGRPQVSVMADLMRHEKTVNVVGFCPSDNGLLASADDGGDILIWRFEGVLDTSPDSKEKESTKKATELPNIFGDNDVDNVEQWSMHKVLRGHLESVVDISWSPDGQYLISGSVDNSAYIWDVSKQTRLHLITTHKNWVQGVSWDPANFLLTSISADRCMRIFDSKTLKVMHTVDRAELIDEKGNKQNTRLFFDYTFQSLHRRLSFTSGGEFLLVPSGIIESPEKKTVDKETSPSFTNVCYLFKRACLSRPLAYVATGSEMTVAAKACPKRFTLREGSNQLELPYRIVFAVITQKSVIIYDSQQLLPISYLTDIHYCNLTDISWSADGCLLLVTSVDGYTTLITFAKDELGKCYEGPALPIAEEKPEKLVKSKAINVLVPKRVKSDSSPKVPVKSSSPKVTIGDMLKRVAAQKKSDENSNENDVLIIGESPASQELPVKKSTVEQVVDAVAQGEGTLITEQIESPLLVKSMPSAKKAAPVNVLIPRKTKRPSTCTPSKSIGSYFTKPPGDGETDKKLETSQETVNTLTPVQVKRLTPDENCEPDASKRAKLLPAAVIE
ncbi:Chromatin assembly factor 1 subunit B [Halotydeus destructor]|nr:Chromatin assembly factor 1 subunit B [Halotydeus destructor]